MEAVFEVVGTSEVWHILEERKGTCHLCSGMGDLAITNRAAYYPEQYPDELSPCPSCGGTGVDRETQRQTA